MALEETHDWQAKYEACKKQRDELKEVLEFALAQSGCDGDLCNYQWHEKARNAISKLEQ